MRPLAFLLFALALSFASCEGQISQRVPAVMGDGGGLVNVSMSLVEGNGTVFVSVLPSTGEVTQKSIYDAVAYAYSIADARGPCDVLVSFSGNPSTSYIDGPSAGASLAVMAYALIENRTMRNDSIITGTIESGGAVGPVGGLYEKASSAGDAGARYFITPVESFYEMLLLREVEKTRGITAIQAGNVGDIIDFMLNGSEIPRSSFEIRNRSAPDLPVYVATGLERMDGVSQTMIGLEQALAGSLGIADESGRGIVEFYDAEILRQNAILGKGYAFSAANEAFLNYIDLLTIDAVGKDEVDIPRAKGAAGICLGGVERPPMTDRNFEWVAGSDQRRSWAMEKINSTESVDGMLEDERLYAFNRLMYARAWCAVSKSLLSAAPEGGNEINESAWEPYAREKVGEARAMAALDEDHATRLNIAQGEYEAGRYAAAIFDAVYVIETGNPDTPPADDETVDTLISSNMSSLWGRVYQSHAAFLLAQNQTQAAYRAMLFAKALDDATLRMVDEGEYAAETPAVPDGRPIETDGGAPDGLWGDFIIAFASILLLLVLLLLLTRRKHGDDGKGPLKADRAEQEEGRARVPAKGPRRKA